MVIKGLITSVYSKFKKKGEKPFIGSYVAIPAQIHFSLTSNNNNNGSVD